MNNANYEIEKQLKDIEGNENFIGFCSFDLFLDDDENNTKDGMLKISRHNITPESGFLKFSFIVDVYGDKKTRKQVADLFGNFLDTALDSDLDPNFMYIRPPEPKSTKDINWFIGDVFFHFDSLKACSKENLVNFFIPFLTLRISIEFHDLQWWEESEGCLPQKKSALNNIKEFIRSKF